MILATSDTCFIPAFLKTLGIMFPPQPRHLGTRSGRDTGNVNVIGNGTETVSGSETGSGSETESETGSGSERKKRKGTATLRSQKWMMR